jgi:glycosyltransferase involved in cell wall biosynthesis
MSTAWSGASAEVPVSVVIPCFQAHATLPRAVASVAQQTARALEVIVVDDASNAGTSGVLRELQLCYGAHWLRVIRLESNQGPASARNAGWDAARGDFVAFLDSDDSWHPRKLEIQLRFMQEHPEFALTGHGHVAGGMFDSSVNDVPHAEVSARALLLSNRFVTPSVMVRRTLSARFRSGQRHMEDHLLWMQLALDGQRIARIGLPLASLYKPQFGAGGQSGDLKQMEAAELANYRLLRREGRIGGLQCGALLVWSAAKYLRRIARVALRGQRGI